MFVKNVVLYLSLLRKILLILLNDITVTSRTIHLRSVPRFSTQHLICSFTLYPYSLCVYATYTLFNQENKLDLLSHLLLTLKTYPFCSAFL